MSGRQAGGWRARVGSGRVRRFAAAVGQMALLAWQVYPAGCLTLGLLDLTQGLIPLATAWVLKALFDLLAQAGRSGSAPTLLLLSLLGAQAGLSVGSQILAALSGYVTAELGRRLTLRVEVTVYGKIAGLGGLAPFEDPRLHDTIQLAAGAAPRGPAQIVTVGATLGRSLVTIGGFVGVLLSFNPLLAGVVGVGVLPHLYARLRLGRQHVALATQQSAKERQVWYFRHILANVAFAKEVQVFDLGGYFLRAFTRALQAIQGAQRTQQRRDLAWQVGLAGLSNGIGAGVFALVVLQALTGRISLGDVTLYTSAVASLQMALAGLILAVSELSESVLFYRHFTDLLALSPPLPVAQPARPVPPLQRCIELRHVSFRYSPTAPWVLQDVSLVLPAGQCTALVGLNGAGKTTLVKLLARLYDPLDGEILWDGCDIRTFDPQELRRHVGAIFQDFAHYDLTARENIGLGHVPQVENSAAVQQAARAADVHERITALPQGYGTLLSRWLGEGQAGTELSGGEWQRVALARLFMRQADLLLLDEPTAALDALAEQQLHDRLVEVLASQTSVLITHRFSTVRAAARIVVLEDGRIAEEGTHNDLLRRQGRYAQLYRQQAVRYQ